MPVILEERSKAEEYAVQADDTLETIAKKAADKYGKEVGDWKLLARFNWGTDDPREVARALAETVGVRLADYVSLAATPEKIKLAPDAELSPKLRLPKPWKKDSLPIEKTHTVKLKPAPKPATAVGITALDKWFIPKEEECEVKYRLEGDGECADKVQLDVFGSNYCECTNWSKGLGTYGSPADLIETPVFRLALNDQAAERQGYALTGGKAWKGQSNADKGLLSRKTGGAAERFINVAFSPYTAHFRYYKNDGDKKARLMLEPFWPQFEETKAETTDANVDHGGAKKAVWSNAAEAQRGAVVFKDKNGRPVHFARLDAAKLAAGNQELAWDGSYSRGAVNSKFGTAYIDDDKNYSATVTTVMLKLKADSLKVKWELKNTGGKLERGLLEITDGKGKLVFQKPLVKGKLGDGKQDFAWDGKYADGVKNSKGGDKVIPEDMPYRVQIQAHTGVDKAEGLALAAMHTEVRLSVHKETAAPKDATYDAWTAQPSMDLGLGPLVPGNAPASGDGTKWYQHQLAQLGFHPGPVNGAKHEAYKLALKEFKRSVPKAKASPGDDYARLAINEDENAETKKAIENIEAKYKRKMFGDPAKVLANSDDPDFTDGEMKTVLPDVSKEVVVWADDRQYYTSGDPAKDDGGSSFYTEPFNLKNYRAGMTNGDGKTDLDTAAIARPWVPLQVGLQLLSRAEGLYDNAALTTDATKLASMRRAIGPLRVDWTFDELPPDVSVVDTAHANYATDFVRSRSYVAWAVDQNKASYTRPDTKRAAIYTNCPESLGGIRPSGLATYYEKAFGFDDLSLAPWRAAKVSATESVATVVHDHIAAGQKAQTDLFEPLIGTAGAYFTPSRVAGDGYRVRAEVVFQKFTGYEFPNLAVLAARYPVTPQAHTARLRVWRRSSFRGYVCWGAPTGNWGNTFINAFRTHYRGAHVYFVHEAGTAANSFNITDVFNPATDAHKTPYKKIVKNNVAQAALQDMAKMSLRSDALWPWGDQRDMGWDDPSPVDTTKAQLFANWLNGEVFNETWRKFRAALLMALLKEVEKKGCLRGHLLVEFDASPAFFIEKYQCNRGAGAQHTYWFIENATGAGGRKNGTRCPSPGCFSDPPANATRSVLNAAGDRKDYPNGMPLPAVGGALGATWLFWRGENPDRLKGVWVHEVGHHRHMEHAANGPGAVANLHDSESNTKFAGWAGVGGGTVATAKQWDRRCIMSYSDAWYGENGFLCGRCLLRNRGWKVTGLGFPGPNKGEP